MRVCAASLIVVRMPPVARAVCMITMVSVGVRGHQHVCTVHNPGGAVLMLHWTVCQPRPNRVSNRMLTACRPRADHVLTMRHN